MFIVWEFWIHRKLKLSGNVFCHVSLNTLKPYYPVTENPLRTPLFNVILNATQQGILGHPM